MFPTITRAVEKGPQLSCFSRPIGGLAGPLAITACRRTIPDDALNMLDECGQVSGFFDEFDDVQQLASVFHVEGGAEAIEHAVLGVADLRPCLRREVRRGTGKGDFFNGLLGLALHAQRIGGDSRPIEQLAKGDRAHGQIE